MQHIEQIGFERVIRLGNIVLYWSLVQSLIERWRPETSTFHFGFGEATITLQDVECLLGIRTEGNDVTGSDEAPEGGWGPYIENHLDIQKVIKNKILFKDLEDFICLEQARLQLIDNLPLKHAQVVVSFTLGGLLFLDTNGNNVYCHLVRALVEDKTFELSWGSACLAILYKNLSKAALNPLPKTIGSCIVLLQIWAWQRYLPLQPRPITPFAELPQLHPHGYRWSGRKYHTNVSTHNLESYKEQLAVMSKDRFLFSTYEDQNWYVQSNQTPWTSTTFLICWRRLRVTSRSESSDSLVAFRTYQILSCCSVPMRTSMDI